MRSRQLWLTVFAATILAALVVGAAGYVVIGDPETTAGEFQLVAVVRARTLDSTGSVVESTSELRWSYSPPSKWRHEVVADGASEALKVTVSDGDYLWHYYPNKDAYCRMHAKYKGSVLTIPDGMPPAFIGPSSEPTLERFLAQLRSIDPSVEVVDAGAEQYLSRTVRVIAYTPAAPAGNGWSGSSGRIWIDPEEMFVLRHRIEETGGQHRFYDSSVVELASDNADQDVFRFEPPVGATEFLPVDGNCDQGVASK